MPQSAVVIGDLQLGVTRKYPFADVLLARMISSQNAFYGPASTKVSVIVPL